MNYEIIIVMSAIFLIGFLIGGECFHKKKKLTKPKTRFEKIRQMSVEEMATLFDDIEETLSESCKLCKHHSENGLCYSPTMRKDCHKAFVKWLNQTVND